MQSAQNHIIDKLFLEVKTSDEKMAHIIKNNVSSFLNSELFPKLEILFDSYNLDSQVFRFESVEIDCNVDDWDKLETIKHEILNSIEILLSKRIIKSRHDNTLNKNGLNKNEIGTTNLKLSIDSKQNYESTFLFFLKNGFLPWFGKRDYIIELTEAKQWVKSLNNKQFLAELIDLFATLEKSVNRFVLQFNNEQVLKFIDAAATLEICNITKLLSYCETLKPASRKVFLRMLVKISSNNPEYKNDLHEFVRLQLIKAKNVKKNKQFVNDWYFNFQQIMDESFSQLSTSQYFQLSNKTNQKLNKIAKNIIDAQLGGESEGLKSAILGINPTVISQEFVNSVMEKEPPFFEKDINEIVVRNAGLVLFHPFLKTLFSNFGWINDNGEIGENRQNEAVQTLHYAASGNEYFFEGYMILEKFMCNIPLDTPIPSESLLNSRIKTEADTMLNEIIKHWPALKNTSPSGLREMFVNRNGKLIQKENSYRLIVERKVQDILLEKLQWNISIVKLPWKKELLFVEW